MQHHKTFFFMLSIRMNDVTEAILLVCSFMFCFRKYTPSYMRSLPLYCIMNFIPTVTYIVFPAQLYLFEFWFTIFELFYFTYFFCSIFESKRAKYYMSLFCVMSLFPAFYFLFVRGINPISLMLGMTMAIYCECFLFVGASLQYFRQMANSRLIFKISVVPSFWMVAGILFYFVMLVPTMSFSILAYANKHTELGDAMYTTNNFAQIISSSLFIVAMLCSKKNS